ncbi:MAG: hypothetical protein HY727_17405 [Candidatus Rokubacteria bacterium]|nr:hypothetical protein [Candidatus Rokubacteria bacterium]
MGADLLSGRGDLARRRLGNEEFSWSRFFVVCGISAVLVAAVLAVLLVILYAWSHLK